MSYAYAYDTGAKLMSEFGFTGLPSAILLDAGGVVKWAGHPAALQGKDVEEALAGALPMPLWEWPAGVRKPLQKREYAAALEAALALADQGVAEKVRGVIAGRLAGLEARLAAGDFLGATELSGELLRSFKGLPEHARVAEISEQIKSDPKAQELILAQKEVAKIAAEMPALKKKKDAEKLKERLGKIQQKHPGTYPAEQAGKLAEKLHKGLSKLK